MTRDEAVTVLGVSEDAAAAVVRQRFEALHNEYHVRLTNAPTPALKKVYQRNLQELQEACRTLVPGFDVATTQDLPAPEPVHVGDLREPSRRSSTTTAAARVVPREDGSIPAAAKWGIVAAAVFAALATLFGLLWQRERSSAAKLREQVTATQAKFAEMSASHDRLQTLLKPAPLKICNDSAKQVRIVSVVAVYAQPDGSVRSVFSGAYGYPTWEIRPGGRMTLSIMRGAADDWDGTAALYSLLLDYPGMEPYLVSGVMSNHKSGCVNLAFE